MKLDCLRMLGAVALLFALTGCEHKLMEEHQAHTTLRICYDWHLAPDATPASMGIWFYPVDGSGPAVRADFSGREGGTVSLAPGVYDIISYNTDGDNLLRRNQSSFALHSLECFEGALFAHTGGYTFPALDTQRVMDSPDPLWGCTRERVEVKITSTETVMVEWRKPNPQSSSQPLEVEGQSITLEPRQLHALYSYEAEGMPPIDSVSCVSASISSLAHSLTLNSGRHGSEAVTVALPSLLSASGTASGQALTFGRSPEASAGSQLTLYLWMSDGRRCYYQFDVTEQIASAPDPQRVHLKLTCTGAPTSVKLDPTPGSGHAPSVADWITENHDLPMR